MFVQFQTVKGENMLVNVEKIMLISNGKRGVCLVMDDGMPFDLSEEYETVVNRLLER